MPSPPRVELLWWRGCPSWPEAIDLVREEMAAVGIDPKDLLVSEVFGEADAERRGFRGSPTILVDGRDIVTAPDQGGSGLTCRVYRTGQGRPSPLPEREAVRAALVAGSEETTR